MGQIDAVLLSHSDTSHLGALPYLVGKAGLKVPIYATLPVHKMGLMFMYDHYLVRQVSPLTPMCAHSFPIVSLCSLLSDVAGGDAPSVHPAHVGVRALSRALCELQSVEDNTVFTLDDVDAAFAAVHPLKYSQGVHLAGATELCRIPQTPHAEAHATPRVPFWLTQPRTITRTGALLGGGRACAMSAIRVLNGFGRTTGATVASGQAARDGGGGGPSGITVTPYAAGHLLGGTLWKISKDTEDVLYAVDFNHKKERHLNGTVLEQFNRPSLLITDAYTAARTGPSAKERDLADSVMKVLRNDGNVLLPIDTAGRVLELVLHLEQVRTFGSERRTGLCIVCVPNRIFLLNSRVGLSLANRSPPATEAFEGTRHPRQLWGAHKLNAYHLVLYNNVAFNTVEFAKSHLEWMNDAITNTFDTHRTNAFTTRFLNICHSREQLAALGPAPKLVMASMGSLEVGPGRDLFVSWAANPRNLVLFTDMGQVRTFAYRSLTLAFPQQSSSAGIAR